MDISSWRQKHKDKLTQPIYPTHLDALYIAQEEYPEIEIEQYCHVLDAMVDWVKERLPSERYPLRIVQAINCYLYQDRDLRNASISRVC